MLKDYLGLPISVGDRILRIGGTRNYKYFSRGAVVDIDHNRDYDKIKILTDGNTRPGWTYPDRVIVQKAFIHKI